MNPLSLTIEPTPEIVIHAGFPCRLWRGRTADGRTVKLLVALVAVDASDGERPFVQSLVDIPLPPEFLLGRVT